MGRLKRLFLGGTPLLVLGSCLILGGLGLTGQNWHEDRQAGEAASRTVKYLVEQLPEEELHPAPAPTTEEEIRIVENRVLPVQTVDGRDYVGLLQIPSLSLELPVQSPYAFDSLRVSPCLYAGDPYHGNMVICAHNYSSHFGAIKNLKEGDELLFIAMDGEYFRYQVRAQEILDPMSTEEMLDPVGWDLTLFTCTVGGEYRVAVRFSRVYTGKTTPARAGVVFPCKPYSGSSLRLSNSAATFSKVSSSMSSSSKSSSVAL
ncbi:MAG: sortase [Oscillospiraceae bacterium]|nr:sortase [Oscillospiraceae bacterium]